MSILADKNTKIIVQGITGTQASFHVRRSIDYGTAVVGGVTPGKGGMNHLGVPVFDTVAEAVEQTGAETTVLFVPARSVKSALFESARAGIKLAVCISNGVPVLDMLEIREFLSHTPMRLIGPDTPGLITPDEARLGIFPENLHHRGHIGIVSRASTLTYEAVIETNRAGLGQSTVIGLGDDTVIGMDFAETLAMFHQDDDTQAIVMIGKSGGQFEEIGAEWYAQHTDPKPVIAYIAGDINSSEHCVGYAEDIITCGKSTYRDKKRIMREAGIIVVDNINQIHKELALLFK